MQHLKVFELDMVFVVFLKISKNSIINVLLQFN